MNLPSGFPDREFAVGLSRLALSYAAADKGNSKEAKKANKSSNAYEPLFKDSLPPPPKNSIATEPSVSITVIPG